eukprot:340629-Hanusia_phi.AAC.8
MQLAAGSLLSPSYNSAKGFFVLSKRSGVQADLQGTLIGDTAYKTLNFSNVSFAAAFLQASLNLSVPSTPKIKPKQSNVFQVFPGNTKNIKISFQPIVCYAGQLVSLQVGLLDAENFLRFNDNTTLIGITANASTSTALYTNATTHQGFATLNFHITEVNPRLILNVFLLSDPSIHVMTRSIKVVNGFPARLVFIDSIGNQTSLLFFHPSVRVGFVDKFGNAYVNDTCALRPSEEICIDTVCSEIMKSPCCTTFQNTPSNWFCDNITGGYALEIQVTIWDLTSGVELNNFSNYSLLHGTTNQLWYPNMTEVNFPNISIAPVLPPGIGYKLRASLLGYFVGFSNTFLVFAGPPHSIQFLNISNYVAGQPIQLYLQVTDSFGNLIRNSIELNVTLLRNSGFTSGSDRIIQQENLEVVYGQIITSIFVVETIGCVHIQCNTSFVFQASGFELFNVSLPFFVRPGNPTRLVSFSNFVDYSWLLNAYGPQILVYAEDRFKNKVWMNSTLYAFFSLSEACNYTYRPSALACQSPFHSGDGIDICQFPFYPSDGTWFVNMPSTNVSLTCLRFFVQSFPNLSTHFGPVTILENFSLALTQEPQVQRSGQSFLKSAKIKICPSDPMNDYCLVYAEVHASIRYTDGYCSQISSDSNGLCLLGGPTVAIPSQNGTAVFSEIYIQKAGSFYLIFEVLNVSIVSGYLKVEHGNLASIRLNAFTSAPFCAGSMNYAKARLYDKFENLVTNVSINVTFLASSSKYSHILGTIEAQTGEAEVSFVLKLADEYDITALIENNSNISDSKSLHIVPSNVSRMIVKTFHTSVSAGGVLSFFVNAYDVYNNTIKCCYSSCQSCKNISYLLNFHFFLMNGNARVSDLPYRSVQNSDLTNCTNSSDEFWLRVPTVSGSNYAVEVCYNQISDCESSVAIRAYSNYFTVTPSENLRFLLVSKTPTNGSIFAGETLLFFQFRLQDVYSNFVLTNSNVHIFVHESLSNFSCGQKYFKILPCPYKTIGLCQSNQDQLSFVQNCSFSYDCTDSSEGISMQNGSLIFGVEFLKTGIEYTLEVCPTANVRACNSADSNWCSITPGREGPLSVSASLASRLQLVNCSVNTSHPLTAGDSMSCIFSFQDSYGNPTLLQNTSKISEVYFSYLNGTLYFLSNSYVMVYGEVINGTAYEISNFPTSTKSSRWLSLPEIHDVNEVLNVKYLKVTIPSNGSSFDSPFKEVASYGKITFLVSNFPPVKSNEFSITSGNISSISFASIPKYAIAGKLLTEDQFGIIFLDKFGNQVSQMNSQCALTTLQLYSDGRVIAPQQFLYINANYGRVNFSNISISTTAYQNMTIYINVTVVQTGESFFRLLGRYFIYSGAPTNLNFVSEPLSSVSFERVRGNLRIQVRDAFGNNFSCPMRLWVKLQEESVQPSALLTGTLFSTYSESTSMAEFSNLSVHLNSSHGTFRIIAYFCKATISFSSSCPSGFDQFSIRTGCDSNFYDLVSIANCQQRQRDTNFVCAVSKDFEVRSVFSLKLNMTTPVGKVGPFLPNSFELYRTLQNTSVGVLGIYDYQDRLLNISIGPYTVSIPSNPSILSVSPNHLITANEGYASFTDVFFALPGNNLKLVFRHLPSGFLSTSQLFNVESLDVIHLNLSWPSQNVNLSWISQNVKVGQSFPPFQAGEAFSHQPTIKILDYFFQSRFNFSNSTTSILTHVPPRLTSNNLLYGKTSVPARNGISYFTDLRIDSATRRLRCAHLCLQEYYAMEFLVSQSNGFIYGQPDKIVVRFQVLPGNISNIFVVQQPGSTASGFLLSRQPILELTDKFNNLIEFSPNASQPYQIVATLNVQSAVSAILTGHKVVSLQNATVNFTDLGMEGPSLDTYKIKFSAISTSIYQNSNEYSIRTPAKLVVLTQPNNPAIWNEAFSATPQVGIYDEKGYLVTANYSITVSLVLASQAQSQTFQSESGMEGSNVSYTGTTGIATFANLVMKSTALIGNRFVLLFAISTPGVPSVYSTPFDVNEGIRNQFRIVIQPYQVQTQGVPFSNWNTGCPPNVKPPNGGAGCGPVVILRGEIGNLIISGQSVSLDLIACPVLSKNSTSCNPLSCTCENRNDLLANSTVCEAVTNAAPGYVSFPNITVRVTLDVVFFLKLTRYSDSTCSVPTSTYLYSQAFKVTSSLYSNMQIDKNSCPKEGSVFIAGKPIVPQPNLIGVFDSNNAPSNTFQNLAFATVYKKPYRNFQLSCSYFPECFASNSFLVTNRNASFQLDGTAKFTNLTVMTSTRNSAEVSGELKFYLRIYTKSFGCSGSSCGFIGKLIYADCPYPFSVIPGSQLKLKIETNPSFGYAGSPLVPIPVIRVVDSFGNLVNITVTITIVLFTDQSLNQTFNNLYLGSAWTESYNGTISNGRLALPNQKASPTFFQSRQGFRMKIYSLVSNVGSATSQPFTVFPCSVRSLSLYPQNVTAVAGNAICGPDGSAWEEIDRFQQSTVEQLVDFKTSNSTLASYCTSLCGEHFSDIESECSQACSKINTTENPILTVQNISGNPKSGMRSWDNNFYAGSYIHIYQDSSVIPPYSINEICNMNHGCIANGIILAYDASNGIVLMSLKYFSHNSTMPQGLWYRIFLNHQQLTRKQVNRCVLGFYDQFGNLVENEIFAVRAHFYLKGTEQRCENVSSADFYSVGGLLTFPNLIMYQKGNFSLKFSTENVSLSSLNFNHNVLKIDVTIVNGPRNHIKILQQPSHVVISGSKLQSQPIVSIQDAYGNIVSSSCEEVTATLYPCASNCVFTSVADKGTATFNNMIVNSVTDSLVSKTWIIFHSGCCTAGCKCYDNSQRHASMQEIDLVSAPCINQTSDAINVFSGNIKFNLTSQSFQNLSHVQAGLKFVVTFHSDVSQSDSSILEGIFAQANIFEMNSNTSSIVSNTTISQNGQAVFTSLNITQVGEYYFSLTVGSLVFNLPEYAFNVKAGLPVRLNITSQPSIIYAGVPLGQNGIKVRLLDFFGNVVYSPQWEIEMNLQEAANKTLRNYICASFLCQYVTYAAPLCYSTSSSSQADCISNCLTSGSCKAVTYFFNGSNCLTANEYCHSPSKASTATILYFFGKIYGQTQVQTNDGEAFFNATYFTMTGRYKVSICAVASPSICTSLIFTVRPNENEGYKLFVANPYIVSDFEGITYTPTNILQYEYFSVAVRVTDAYNNTLISNFTVMVYSNASSTFMPANGTNMVHTSNGIANFTDIFFDLETEIEVQLKFELYDTLTGMYLNTSVLSKPFVVGPPVKTIAILSYNPNIINFPGNEPLLEQPKIGFYFPNQSLARITKSSVRAFLTTTSPILKGTSKKLAIQGIAQFTDLTFGGTGQPPKLKFELVNARKVSIITNQTNQMYIGFTPRTLHATLESASHVFAGQPFRVSVSISSSVTTLAFLPSTLRQVKGEFANATVCQQYATLCAQSLGVFPRSTPLQPFISAVSDFNSLILYTSGNFTLTFCSGVGCGDPVSTTIISNPITVIVQAGRMTSLVVSEQVSIATAGVPFSNVIVAHDTFGNVVQNASFLVQVSLKSNDCTLNSGLANNPLCGQLLRPNTISEIYASIIVTMDKGVAYFSCLAVDKAYNNYILTFKQMITQSSYGLQVDGKPFNVLAGKVAAVSVFQTPSQNGHIIAGELLNGPNTPIVLLVDNFGNVYRNTTGITVVMSAEDLNRTSISVGGQVVGHVSKEYITFPGAYITKSGAAIFLSFNASVPGGSTFKTTSVVPFPVYGKPIVNALPILAAPSAIFQGEIIKPSPAVRLVDMYGNTAVGKCFSVQIFLSCLNPEACDCSRLSGQTIVATCNGVVQFTDVYTFAATGNYIIHFKLLDSKGSFAIPLENDCLNQSQTLSSQFNVTIKETATNFIVKPGPNESCYGIMNKTLCSDKCTWDISSSPPKCTGMRSANAGEFLLDQPTVEFRDSNNNLVTGIVDYFVHVTVDPGAFGLIGTSLEAILTGNLSVKVEQGTAKFTDLKILVPVQGVRLRFTVVSCCGRVTTLTGKSVLSPSFQVYAPITYIRTLLQPSNTYAGMKMNSSIKTQLIDSDQNPVIFTGIEMSVLLKGGIGAQCPSGSKTLYIPSNEVELLWTQYSSVLVIDNLVVLVITKTSFIQLLQVVLKLNAQSTVYDNLFKQFDLDGNGYLSHSEFTIASYYCVCEPGYVGGLFEIISKGNPYTPGEVNLTNISYCIPRQSCTNPFQYLCDQGAARTRKFVERINRFNFSSADRLGTSNAVRIIDGIAFFDSLQVFEAGVGLYLQFTFRQVVGNSQFFNVYPQLIASNYKLFFTTIAPDAMKAGTKFDISAVMIDGYQNFVPTVNAQAVLQHSNVSLFSNECNSSTQILPCDTCPDTIQNYCPGPRCPFRCDFSNVNRIKSSKGIYKEPLQACSYYCKQGCTFMCGNMHSNLTRGIVIFTDLQIKRNGVHEFVAVLRNSFELSTNKTSEEFAVQFAYGQKLVMAQLMMSQNQYSKVVFNVTNSDPFYVISDFGPTFEYQNSATEAGKNFDPPPRCLVTDFYGNVATNSKIRVGLVIRDGDRDQYNLAEAKQKYYTTPLEKIPNTSKYVGWPPNSAGAYPIGLYVDEVFSISPFENQSATDDEKGCPSQGGPQMGCPGMSDSPYSVSQRDTVINYKWCPSSQEKRYCRTCLTAQRYFQSYNASHWTQQYTFVDPISQQVQRGAFDCQGREHCTGSSNCLCLIPLHEASGNTSFDVCSACQTRSLPMGLPVAWTESGIATFQNIFCSVPKRGYRFQCIVPPGDQGNNAIQPLLYSVSWDWKDVRTPRISFINDGTWLYLGPFTSLLWQDPSGNQHPDAILCESLCVNRTTEPNTPNYPTSNCPRSCYKYGYPYTRNPTFAYVRPESPGLSEVFPVTSGEVAVLLILKPYPNSVADQVDRSFSSTNSSFTPDSSPEFQMADAFGNPNRTSQGIAQILLRSSPSNIGAELSGNLQNSLSGGVAKFPLISIDCPGKHFQLQMKYFPNSTNMANYIQGLSSLFDVLPSPPRLVSVRFTETWDGLYVVIDRYTTQPPFSSVGSCNEILRYVLSFNASTNLYKNNSICSTQMSGSAACDNAMLGQSGYEYCDWFDSRTIHVKFGLNAQVMWNDLVFVKGPSGGLAVQRLVNFGSYSLTSKSWYVSENIGFIPLRSDRLSLVAWACIKDAKTGACSPASFGEHISKIRLFEQNGKQFLVVLRYCIGSGVCVSYKSSDSMVIYEMISDPSNKYYFQLISRQSIALSGPVDVECFSLPYDIAAPKKMCAVAQYYDGLTFSQSALILSQSTGDFASSTYNKFAAIPCYKPTAVKFENYGKSSFLLITGETESYLTRWIPGQFVIDPNNPGSQVWQDGYFQVEVTISSAAASQARFFLSGNNFYIGISNFHGETPCTTLDCPYKYSRSSFVDIFLVGHQTTLNSLGEQFQPCNSGNPSSFSVVALAGISLNSTFARAGNYIQIEDEIMMLTTLNQQTQYCLPNSQTIVSYPNNKLVVQRGISSSASNHPNGIAVYFLPKGVYSSVAPQPYLQLPGTGIMDFVHFRDSDRDYIMCANYFSGCNITGYDQESLIFSVDFENRTYDIHQRIATQGGLELLLFNRTLHDLNGDVTTKIYVAVANHKSNSGNSVQSQLFEWTNVSAELQPSYKPFVGLAVKASYYTTFSIAWLLVPMNVNGEDRSILLQVKVCLITDAGCL